ncbi:type III restriction-modification system endonuclease [Hoylesella timonensis]|uniref:type III restriction-modification system endonuclease n=1 Tax=Hoylesella timonensis TaxID=386414 RepID=UPI00336A45CF
MKFKFKIQQYQTDAVEQTVEVFSGQPSKQEAKYRRDLGKTQGRITYEEDYIGFRNNEVELNRSQLLDNIHRIQGLGNIPRSNDLVATHGLGACSLDIEMETGTGKTYVYIKTMFELNKRYGWTKFIVVVPSIAIREGVAKSFAMLEDHFMEQYGKKARYFIYDSSNLQKIDSYSSDANINVMIINTQAFNTSLKEGARNKEARIIYSIRDDFNSRRPIDVIAANRPIIIMDEPQKMEGAATQKALRNFRPLFVLNYSATHKTSHNCIYALDALDAYQQKLVKKIQVKGITLQNLQGTSCYIYFDSIVLSKNRAPQVRLEIDMKGKTGIRRRTLLFNQHDNLYTSSKGLEEYRNMVITDIIPEQNKIVFQNGEHLHKGDVMGDVSEETLQRVQIRETIKSHFAKEEMLFRQGIKTLSLFFIDEVSNYKTYDEEGNTVPQRLWNVFEEEYTNFLNANLSAFDDDYQKYLRQFSAKQVHNGYFSVDKKGHSINSKLKRGENYSSDISAYDLILKNKERLLSFDEPTRFIFSHSALSEGWDNPNVFQICTLRHTQSGIRKRQEVGRGLRICVDERGNRMDYEHLGDAVHEINKLTVIANENYEQFVDALQKETKEALRERPTKATAEYFAQFTVTVDGEKHQITTQEAASIVAYLYDNDYVDEEENITQEYRQALADGTLEPVSKKLRSMEADIHKLIQGIFDPSVLAGMVEDGNKSAEVENSKLNDNASKEEFKALWNEINRRYVYTVHYDSEELIRNVIKAIDEDLTVTQLRYIVTTGEQSDDELEFNGVKESERNSLTGISTSTVEYDLVGEIVRDATLTRRTVVRILKGIQPVKQRLFRNNPEEFIRNVVRIIKEQKATMIIQDISYSRTENTFDSNIFTRDKHKASIDRVYNAKKCILDYVFCDSDGERKFAQHLDEAKEVCVYARLPRSFKIPTPVGNYAPDWAIAFYDGMGVKHIYFIAETKGAMGSMNISPIESSKIKCARKLYNVIKDTDVRYQQVTDYDTLLDIINEIR